MSSAPAHAVSGPYTYFHLRTLGTTSALMQAGTLPLTKADPSKSCLRRATEKSRIFTTLRKLISVDHDIVQSRGKNTLKQSFVVKCFRLQKRHKV